MFNHEAFELAWQADFARPKLIPSTLALDSLKNHSGLDLLESFKTRFVKVRLCWENDSESRANLV